MKQLEPNEREREKMVRQGQKHMVTDRHRGEYLCLKCGRRFQTVKRAKCPYGCWD